MQLCRFAVLAVLAVLGATGCTASWNAVVQYSPEPAVPGLSVEAAVYAAILSEYAAQWETPKLIVAETGGEPVAAFTVTSTGRGVIRIHWTDSLKREVATALADTALRAQASLDSLRAAVGSAGIGVTLVREGTADRPLDPANRIPQITLSRPGFNADSTLAAVYVSFWCGPLCGHGTFLLLARRPGFQWRTWHGTLSWVS